jgi:molecular chaperone GrpE
VTDETRTEQPEVETEETSAPEGAEASEEQQAAETEVAEDLDQLVAKARERDEYLALAQRTQADFENYRRRMAR